MDFDNRLLDFMHQLADTAGVIARQYWRMPIATEQKADLSPVTIADREIERRLRQRIEASFPEHGIVGEEDGALRPKSLYQWVIDPIDGTRSFIAGFTTFTTLIALCNNGVPVAGVIDQPITKERWAAVSGKPTLLNGTPVKSGNKTMLDQAIITTTSTYYFNTSEKDAFETLRKRCASVTLGGDAYSYALLASGHVDIVVEAGTKPYDYCALAPIVEGAGGVITDWRGKKLTLSSSGQVLATANAALHQQALALLMSTAA